MEVYYYTSGKRQPVREYVDALPQEERAVVAAALLDIEEHDLEGTTVTRHIDGKLWELKISRHRIFYVLIVGPVMVLLHAYKKQGQKAPSRELDVARKRMKEILGE